VMMVIMMAMMDIRVMVSTSGDGGSISPVCM
jgi:hypothetical protein